MKSVLSHIVQKQFSGEYENIVTEALAYIVQKSDRARDGLLKMLRGVKPDLPNLSFQTQQSEDNKRPDMWGLDSGRPWVFIENKFWAGFTENQPVEYIKLLAGHNREGILLMVVPAARQESAWREMLKRLKEFAIDYEEQKPTADIPRVVKTGSGPLLAVTTWAKLLQSIDDELADEPGTRNDLVQLKALCETAESDAYVPIRAEETSNQRIPALFIQLNMVTRKAVEIGETEGLVNTKGLRDSCTTEGIGRYIRFSSMESKLKLYAWIGINFPLWLKHGATPLWLCFRDQEWGNSRLMQSAIEPWLESGGIFASLENNIFCISINVPAGEDFDYVVRDIVDQLKKVADKLKELPPVREISDR
jgi:hypothetical protein